MKSYTIDFGISLYKDFFPTVFYSVELLIAWLGLSCNAAFFCSGRCAPYAPVQMQAQGNRLDRTDQVFPATLFGNPERMGPDINKELALMSEAEAQQGLKRRGNASVLYTIDICLCPLHHRHILYMPLSFTP